ncbi:MAG TPA: hypothetical protein EYP36_04630, partial [Calditrichaeota bacterium]|nr:hypothetical protein [Calditrichota bacterium]
NSYYKNSNIINTSFFSHIKNRYKKINIFTKRDHLDFELEFDKEYLKRRRNKITKVITLEGEEQEQIRGVLAPLSIKAEPEILRLIYDMGLGQLNNWGFGMVERVHGAN